MYLNAITMALDFPDMQLDDQQVACSPVSAYSQGMVDPDKVSEQVPCHGLLSQSVLGI